MPYRIVHRSTGMFLSYDAQKDRDAWQAEKEGSTSLSKDKAVELAKKLGLRNEDYKITNE